MPSLLIKFFDNVDCFGVDVASIDRLKLSRISCIFCVWVILCDVNVEQDRCNDRDMGSMLPCPANLLDLIGSRYC